MKGSGVVPLVYNRALARTLTVLSSAAIIILLARLTQQARSLPERDRAFGAAVIAALLVSPVTWEHGFLLLLLPFGIFWAGTLAGSSHRGVLVLLAAVLMILNPATFYRLWLLGDVHAGERAFCTAAQVVSILSVQCYALLTLFAMGLRRTLAAEPAAGGEPIISDVQVAKRRRAA